ncbi:MAG TPA: hypothetical protein VGA87_03860, partial [Pyrinomonadaceae bacterium]
MSQKEEESVTVNQARLMIDEQQKETAAELLGRTRVEVAPATFVLVGMRHEDWSRLLEQPELSPRASVPFMLLRDTNE